LFSQVETSAFFGTVYNGHGKQLKAVRNSSRQEIMSLGTDSRDVTGPRLKNCLGEATINVQPDSPLSDVKDIGSNVSIYSSMSQTNTPTFELMI
jgi:hypothetical protein